MKKLQLEVIPNKCIGRNLHSHKIIGDNRWNDISHRIRNNGCCYYCKKKFDIEELNAHEVWEFDESNRIQRLKDIVCVCKKCHMTVHYHFLLSSNKLGDRDALICKAHYMEVNDCYEKEFEKDLDAVLYRYRTLNQIEGDWSMDIIHVLKEGLLVYGDINIENLEKIAPGSTIFLTNYKTQTSIYFNKIPLECLIDQADQRHKNKESEVCEICGNTARYLYQFYDFRIKPNSMEMFLSGTKQICALCRKTIYHGSHRTFMRFRKTTKHYMRINNCSYEECKRNARDARNYMKIASTNLYIYLKTPYIPKYEHLNRKAYLHSKGAKLFHPINKWYLHPVRNLKDFRPFL